MTQTNSIVAIGAHAVRVIGRKGGERRTKFVLPNITLADEAGYLRITLGDKINEALKGEKHVSLLYDPLRKKIGLSIKAIDKARRYKIRRYPAQHAFVPINLKRLGTVTEDPSTTTTSCATEFKDGVWWFSVPDRITIA